MGEKIYEKIECFFQGIGASDDNDRTIEQAFLLIETLLEELAGDESRIFDSITDDSEKKRILALFSKMIGNIQTFLSSCQPELEKDVQRMEGRLSDLKSRESSLNAQKQQLARQITELNAEHRQLFFDEQQIKQQKKQLDSFQARQRELNEEEQRVYGKDGMALEQIKERQKELQNHIDGAQTTIERQETVLHLLSRFFVQESDSRIVSNLTQLQQELADLGQGDVDTDERITNTFQQLQEHEAAYQAAVIEYEEIKERFALYESNWGEESDFMCRMYERELETPDKLREYMERLQSGLQADLQSYDRMLGEVVAQGESERDAIERRQNKR